MKSEDQPFRFFDNREKYLLFVTTTSEKRLLPNMLVENMIV